MARAKHNNEEGFLVSEIVRLNGKVSHNGVMRELELNNLVIDVFLFWVNIDSFAVYNDKNGN